MRIFICDDETRILEDMGNRIVHILPEAFLTSFSEGKELLGAFEKSSCDVLFLDIDMPGINGLDIAKVLSEMAEKPLLIFVTSHDELVYDSLQYHPFGFIRKSYFENEIEKILKDCEQELMTKEKHFIFKRGMENVRLKLSEILYFESDGRL